MQINRNLRICEGQEGGEGTIRALWKQRQTEHVRQGTNQASIQQRQFIFMATLPRLSLFHSLAAMGHSTELGTGSGSLMTEARSWLLGPNS